MLRVGRVGRPHGRRGAFRVSEPSERFQLFEPGRELTVEGEGAARVVERAGTPERPIVRLAGLDAGRIRGRALLVPRGAIGELGAGEWLIDDLIGCRVRGLGTVTGVRPGRSVDSLEVGGERGEVLVPLNRDAIRSIDVEAGEIEADLEFLGLDEGAGAGEAPGETPDEGA